MELVPGMCVDRVGGWILWTLLPLLLVLAFILFVEVACLVSRLLLLWATWVRKWQLCGGGGGLVLLCWWMWAGVNAELPSCFGIAVRPVSFAEVAC